MDAFLDQEATTAMTVPKPTPFFITVLPTSSVLESPCANNGR